MKLSIINEDTVLEIKCPDVTDLDTLIAGKKYDVKKCDDGTVFLDPKGPRGYYMQIQLTMLCCGMDKAVLFLWRSEEDFQLIDISKNESYLIIHCFQTVHILFHKRTAKNCR